MQKAFFAVIAAIISAWTGFAASDRLKRRVCQLRLLISMLEEMSSVLNYRAMRTEEMLKALSSQPYFGDMQFLSILNGGLDGGLTLREAWRAAAEKADCFTDSDRSILYALGERIGTTDAEGQLSLLAVSREFAERNLREAEEDYRGKGAVLRKTGILCGAALAVFII